MKTKLVALAFLIGMSGAAAAAKVNWQGAIMVTAGTPACEADILVSDSLTLYSPRGIGDNGPDSFLAFFNSTRSATSLKVAGSLPGTNKPYSAKGVGSRGAQTDNAGKFLTFSTTPAVVTAATQTLVINAKISNFYNTKGCTATIQGALVLRRD